MEAKGVNIDITAWRKQAVHTRSQLLLASAETEVRFADMLLAG
jgi:hypothetical protein